MTEDDDAEFDFMKDRLGLSTSGYNLDVDEQIYKVAKMIVDARKNDTCAWGTDIAKALGMSPEHVELIQYILDAVIYPAEQSDKNYTDRSPFTYGSSPRGLFVWSEAKADRFIAEFEVYMKELWGWTP